MNTSMKLKLNWFNNPQLLSSRKAPAVFLSEGRGKGSTPERALATDAATAGSAVTPHSALLV